MCSSNFHTPFATHFLLDRGVKHLNDSVFVECMNNIPYKQASRILEYSGSRSKPWSAKVHKEHNSFFLFVKEGGLAMFWMW